MLRSKTGRGLKSFKLQIETQLNILDNYTKDNSNDRRNYILESLFSNHLLIKNIKTTPMVKYTLDELHITEEIIKEAQKKLTTTVVFQKNIYSVLYKNDREDYSINFSSKLLDNNHSSPKEEDILKNF